MDDADLALAALPPPIKTFLLAHAIGNWCPVQVLSIYEAAGLRYTMLVLRENNRHATIETYGEEHPNAEVRPRVSYLDRGA
jgi:hypothetical protein